MVQGKNKCSILASREGRGKQLFLECVLVTPSFRGNKKAYFHVSESFMGDEACGNIFFKSLSL